MIDSSDGSGGVMGTLLALALFHLRFVSKAGEWYANDLLHTQAHRSLSVLSVLSSSSSSSYPALLTTARPLPFNRHRH